MSKSFKTYFENVSFDYKGLVMQSGDLGGKIKTDLVFYRLRNCLEIVK